MNTHALLKGYHSAPRIFTKVMKPVMSTLRAEGHIILGYIDDFYLQGDSYDECLTSVKRSVNLMTRLGFVVHPDKSVLQPSHSVKFLGFILDSDSMTVRLTPKKISHIIAECEVLFHKHHAQIQFVARVIGLLVSRFPGVDFGPLYY